MSAKFLFSENLLEERDRAGIVRLSEPEVRLRACIRGTDSRRQGPPVFGCLCVRALAKLDELLPEERTVPALSLTDVPPFTNEVDSWFKS